MIAEAAEPRDFIFLCCASSVTLEVLDLLTFAPIGTVSSLSTKLVFKVCCLKSPFAPAASAPVDEAACARDDFLEDAAKIACAGTPISSSFGCCSVPATVTDGTDAGGGGDVWTESCCEDENVTDDMAIVITSSSFRPSTASRYSSSSSPPAVPSNARKPLKFSSIRLITSSFSSSFSVMLSMIQCQSARRPTMGYYLPDLLHPDLMQRFC
uniref:Uncharacterized protein n=1 Tax=Anopheles maculatus TaxID=74869 RepID=A0A182SS91_9DIPT